MGETVTLEAREYFDLEGLARYSGLSVKTLRRYMADEANPLPNHKVTAAGLDRGRVLVARREFDAWVATFPALQIKPRPAKVEAVPAARLRRAR